MDWVHCNNCFKQPHQDATKFYLTNCGHIFCESCLKQGNEKQCKICGQQCCTILLTNKMKPEVESFFTKPTDLVKKHLKQMLQALEFQQGHAMRLSSYRRSANGAQTTGNSDVAALFRENRQLKEQNIHLQKTLNGYIGHAFKDAEMRTPGSERRRTPYSSRPLTPSNASMMQQDMRSSRPVTPGSASSQQQDKSVSPYYRGRGMVSPRSQLSMQARYNDSARPLSSSSSPNLPRTPAGPDRLSLRTPPSNGSITSPSGIKGQPLPPSTPDSKIRNNNSQSIYRGVWPSKVHSQPSSDTASQLAPLHGAGYGPKASPTRSQHTLSTRQIQLAYKPKTALNMAHERTHES